jgi:hypothetical protein
MSVSEESMPLSVSEESIPYVCVRRISLSAPEKKKITMQQQISLKAHPTFWSFDSHRFYHIVPPVRPLNCRRYQVQVHTGESLFPKSK